MAFLASGDAAYIAGHVLRVNGDMVMEYLRMRRISFHE
jgi:hypothetical protein